MRHLASFSILIVALVALGCDDGNVDTSRFVDIEFGDGGGLGPQGTDGADASSPSVGDAGIGWGGDAATDAATWTSDASAGDAGVNDAGASVDNDAGLPTLDPDGCPEPACGAAPPAPLCYDDRFAQLDCVPLGDGCGWQFVCGP